MLGKMFFKSFFAMVRKLIMLLLLTAIRIWSPSDIWPTFGNDLRTFSRMRTLLASALAIDSAGAARMIFGLPSSSKLTSSVVSAGIKGSIENIVEFWILIHLPANLRGMPFVKKKHHKCGTMLHTSSFLKMWSGDSTSFRCSVVKLVQTASSVLYCWNYLNLLVRMLFLKR